FGGQRIVGIVTRKGAIGAPRAGAISARSQGARRVDPRLPKTGTSRIVGNHTVKGYGCGREIAHAQIGLSQHVQRSVAAWGICRGSVEEGGKGVDGGLPRRRGEVDQAALVEVKIDLAFD